MSLFVRILTLSEDSCKWPAYFDYGFGPGERFNSESDVGVEKEKSADHYLA